MTDVKAGVEYKINVDGNSFLLDGKNINYWKVSWILSQ